MSKLNLNQSITIASNVGVIVGIVFLAVEINQTQNAVIAATYQARAFNQIDTNLRIADSEAMTSVLARFRPDDPTTFDDLTDADALQLRTFLTVMEIDADNEYYQYQMGFLDADFVETSLKPRVRRLAPVWRALGIDENRAEFREFVDVTLAER